MGSKTIVHAGAAEAPVFVLGHCKRWLLSLYQHWCESFSISGMHSPAQANLFWQRWL